MQFTVLNATIAAFALALTANVSAAQATPRVDCPMRDARYSADSPLMDVLLKPEAMAVLERAAPGIAQSLPPQFASSTPPSFAAIINLRQVAGYGILRGADINVVDTELRALPVTDADRVARCARYDSERPALNFPRTGLRVLLFEKMTGFRDGPSVDAAHAAFVSMAERNQWTLLSTDRGGAINNATLRNVDVIIWNNVSGDVLTVTQRRALRRYMERGGGFVGVHGSGGDPTYFWDWYADSLIGARFIGHPMAPQFQEARIVVPGAPSPIGRNLAPGWSMSDEWYSFARSPRETGATIIAELDERTYSPVGMMNQQLRMGDHPIAWSRCVRNGRSFYSAIGHRPETYSDPQYVDLLQQAIIWAAGEGETICRNGVERPR